MTHNLAFLTQYGDLAFFRRMADEGFVSVACSCMRKPINGCRIAALFAFYRPLDAPTVYDFVQVPTWQVTKERCASGVGETDYAPPMETRYSEAALAEFLRARNMVLGTRIDLTGLLCAMETQAFDETLAVPT